jgi:hypothetical protein
MRYSTGIIHFCANEMKQWKVGFRYPVACWGDSTQERIWQLAAIAVAHLASCFCELQQTHALAAALVTPIQETVTADEMHQISIIQRHRHPKLIAFLTT